MCLYACICARALALKEKWVYNIIRRSREIEKEKGRGKERERSAREIERRKEK